MLPFVWHSGAGKTTPLQSDPLQILSDVSSGAIYLDGKDIRKIKLTIFVIRLELCRMYTCLQEHYGKYQDMAVRTLPTRKSSAQPSLPMLMILLWKCRINSWHRHWTAWRSFGGQKQRLSIASVSEESADPIFDEATSALITKETVQQSLERLAKDRTTFVIAHRLPRSANFAGEGSWCWTEDGIAEEGTHRITEKDYVYANFAKPDCDRKQQLYAKG